MLTHPGGVEHTRRMLELARLPAGARILDLGAGGGEALRLLRSLGYEARGFDLEPRGEGVERGDLLRTGLPDASFDAVLSQCSFFVSGDVPGALREASRLLRTGGKLLWSDVEFEPLRPAAEAAGFAIEHDEDMSAAWREYFLEALWRDESCCGALPRGRCGYRLLIGRKE